MEIKSNHYSIFVENKFSRLNRFVATKKYSSVFILCDHNTHRKCLPILKKQCEWAFKAQVIKIKTGDKNKNLKTCEWIWDKLLQFQADRNSLLINLGGGVVCDTGGFCASVYKRGIDFVNVPTSLLAMVDAAIGGKTGVNFKHLKNFIGAFYLPKNIFIYPDFTGTLPVSEVLNGYSEMFKIALLTNNRLVDELIKNWGEPDEKIIAQCIEQKENFVRRDPFEKNIRKMLNYGHSIGHALESCFLDAAQEIMHGEAVATGMMMENHIAFQLGLMNEKSMMEINKIIYRRCSTLTLKEISTKQLMNYLSQDKKNSKGKMKFSLLTSIGKYKYDVEAAEKHIEASLKYYKQYKDALPYRTQ